MKENELKNLLLSVSMTEKKSDFEIDAFELIFETCLEKGYKMETILGDIEENSLCEQERFIYLVALQDDSVLELVFNYHQAFASADFCKEELKSKYQILILDNTFEITI